MPFTGDKYIGDLALYYAAKKLNSGTNKKVPLLKAESVGTSQSTLSTPQAITPSSSPEAMPVPSAEDSILDNTAANFPPPIPSLDAAPPRQNMEEISIPSSGAGGVLEDKLLQESDDLYNDLEDSDKKFFGLLDSTKRDGDRGSLPY